MFEVQNDIRDRALLLQYDHPAATVQDDSSFLEEALR
jgi:hypothetical protein